MKANSISGHFASLFTILIWGTTFISTKILLVGFRPVGILHEKVTALTVVRMVMTLMGLFLSEKKLFFLKKGEKQNGLAK